MIMSSCLKQFSGKRLPSQNKNPKQLRVTLEIILSLHWIHEVIMDEQSNMGKTINFKTIRNVNDHKEVSSYPSPCDS